MGILGHRLRAKRPGRIIGASIVSHRARSTSRLRPALLLFGVLQCLAATPQIVWPQTYQVIVSQLRSDVYQIHDGEALILTRHCQERARRDAAILRRDVLIFLDSHESCDVKHLLVRVEAGPGRYVVTL